MTTHSIHFMTPPESSVKDLQQADVCGYSDGVASFHVDNLEECRRIEPIGQRAELDTHCSSGSYRHHLTGLANTLKKWEDNRRKIKWNIIQLTRSIIISHKMAFL